jgi:hypothetical protein
VQRSDAHWPLRVHSALFARPSRLFDAAEDHLDRADLRLRDRRGWLTRIADLPLANQATSLLVGSLDRHVRLTGLGALVTRATRLERRP